MSSKKMESLDSKKFDVNESTVIGGVGPTYGKWYPTSGGKYDANGRADEARTTFNSTCCPTPNSGQDDLTYCE
jgi:hypothetical protein